jgi:hypothetical protein
VSDPEPTASETGEAAGNYTYSDDGAPDANQPAADVLAEPPAGSAKRGSKLALTGTNTIAVLGGGVLLLLIGLVVRSTTRRRRTRTGWR